MLRLDSAQYGNYLLTEVDDNGVETGKDMYIQTDWDFPSIASNFGYTPCKHCRSTDGTVDCEHSTASEMIERAQNFLDSHIGDYCDNPGYEISDNMSKIPTAELWKHAKVSIDNRH